MPELIVVGRLGRPQGIKGEVTVEVRTDDPDDRFAPGKVLQTDPAERGPLTVAGARRQGRYLVVAVRGCRSTATRPSCCATRCCSSTPRTCRRWRTRTSTTTPS